MALVHTILATLADTPHTGYDLWKKFEEAVSCYWKASQQQIYRELTKMEHQGFVDCEIVPQEGKPAKKLYSITEAGKTELSNWIGIPSQPSILREDLLVKIRAGYLVDQEIIIKELQHRHQLHRQKLTAYQEKEKKLFSRPETLSLSEKCRYLTLRRGIRYELEWIAWCEEALEVFQQLNP